MDTVNRTYKYNYEYYLMKHLSHFVKPGARLLTTTGDYKDLLAFQNPDKSIVVVACNDGEQDKAVRIKVGNRTIRPLLKASTFNTCVIPSAGK